VTLSLAQTEGPTYVANPLQRINFQGGAANKGGKALIFTGQVLGQDCQPIANARVDVWHTDAKGEYDLSKTFTSRCYITTDADVRYRFDTKFPVAQLHVKITPLGGKTLTTQVYFPNESANDRDGIFSAALLAQMSKFGGVDAANYDFVVSRKLDECPMLESCHATI
jgi:protocatechuate 3,4-dioxygenase beta subunit